MPKRSPEREAYLATILTVAVEGGIAYWAEGKNYNWGSENGPFELGMFHYASVQVRDHWGDMGRNWRRVTVSTIARGIRLLKTGEVKVSSDITGYIGSAEAEKDASYIDSDAADCIVQAALFGEIVYG
tara:strand:+ start:657 stop:1040 length:384 start_codon:yes stop_codon:yes gene_type:complete